jgi:hypothetical protein
MSVFFCFDEDGWFVDLGGKALGPFASFEAASDAYRKWRAAS